MACTCQVQPATQEAEAGGSFEPNLDNTVRPYLQKSLSVEVFLLLYYCFETRSHYVVQYGLEHTIFVFSLGCWD